MPTAGAHPNTAIRSASGLADELSRVGADTVPLGHELYEKRCRKIVEKNQEDSRTFAKYIFVENTALTWGRDEIIKHYPMAEFVSNIIKAMHDPF